MVGQRILNRYSAVKIHGGGQMKKRPWIFLLIVMGTSSSAWSWAMNDKLLNETRNGIHDPAKALLQEAKINETQAAKAMQEVAQLVPSQ